MATTQPKTPHAMPDTLEARYAEVQARIADAAARARRKPSDILLCAVTKTADPEQIKGLLQLGHRDFAENRVQQLIQHASIVEEYLNRQKLIPSGKKLAADVNDTLFAAGSSNSKRVELKPVASLPGAKEGVRWHMIGHLQRNKAKKVTEFVRLIHSVDSLRIAEELQHIALKKDHVIEVLIQVNCSGEEQKFGCPLPAAIPLAEQIQSMINVRVRGLMTMAPLSEHPEDSRPHFARCRELFEEMQTLGFGEPGSPFNILSMGMSGDYEVAISEGANIVRVGSAIFGAAKTGPEQAELPEPDEE
ncbi:MAG TPA: YggS family pyridoxal phosphate-dependent enzyme [Phycisphaerales bacterium]|nr:YggS family pyridoxal phosphate-dependent enzyme [Phycisphaerales bacterium]